MQHTYETPETLETYTCNIQIYFCHIQMKHLQHMSDTDETFGIYT
jgi:hypothetical protein